VGFLVALKGLNEMKVVKNI